MIKIIVDKPASGGDKGHLCKTCKLSTTASGPGWEIYNCASFGKIQRQVTDCSRYVAIDGGASKYDAPAKIVNLALTMITYEDAVAWLTKERLDVWEDTYDDEKRIKLLERWGFLKNE